VIVWSRSTLSVYSTTRTAAEITRILGVEPTDAHDIGDPTRAALSGRRTTPKAMTHQQTGWSFDADPAGIDPEDRTGFASMRLIVERFRDRADALAELRSDCDTRIWWSGDSNSSQGGFVIPADLLADLALLGCDLFGTAFISTDE
jgi:Domain of unknown function (DUF4279)